MPTAKRVAPVGPVFGNRRAYRTAGNPPGGAASWRVRSSLIDCMPELCGATDSINVGAEETPSDPVGAAVRCMAALISRHADIIRAHCDAWKATTIDLVHLVQLSQSTITVCTASVPNSNNKYSWLKRVLNFTTSQEVVPAYDHSRQRAMAYLCTQQTALPLHFLSKDLPPHRLLSGVMVRLALLLKADSSAGCTVRCL